jgi:crotonobetainyl-CoA:carnitine CoA-transferase CaiB-like acyl-CoA transferase
VRALSLKRFIFVYSSFFGNWNLRKRRFKDAFFFFLHSASNKIKFNKMDIFKNLKVIELASVLAGPAVGMFFAELGAEVLKIENKKTGGDVTRSWKLPSESPTALDSAYFHAVNYGKTHYFLDLQLDTDKEKVLHLVKNADIVVANFKKSSAIALGMDAETLRALNPTLIYASIHGFEEDDDLPAFDVVLQAETGFMYMSGERGRAPVKMPVALIDLLAAHQLKAGILTALLERTRTGKGSTVTVSLYESAVASLANQATNWLMADKIPQRIGSEHPNIAPYGDIVSLKNGTDIVLAVGTEKQWQLLCKVLNDNDLYYDERFKNNVLRVQNRVEMMAILRAKMQDLDAATVLDLLKKNKVPAGAVLNMQQVFEHPQAQKMILTDAEGRGKRVKTAIFKIK